MKKKNLEKEQQEEEPKIAELQIQENVDVIVTSECIHPYFLCIVTRYLFREMAREFDGRYRDMGLVKI